MEEGKKEVKCDHSFVPVGYTADLQVFGLDENDDVFLDYKGFVIVQCVNCDKVGYCILG